MIATRALVRPCVLFAIALLIVNDHVLKAAAPGLLTGKLSDVAGLVFFPLLLAAAAEQLGLRRGMKTIVIATIATGALFAAIKLSVSAAELYRSGLAMLQWPARAVAAALAGDPLPAVGRVSLVRDPSDLIALLALAVPLVVGRRAERSELPSDPCRRYPACTTLHRPRAGRRLQTNLGQGVIACSAVWKPTPERVLRTAKTNLGAGLRRAPPAIRACLG